MIAAATIAVAEFVRIPTRWSQLHGRASEFSRIPLRGRSVMRIGIFGGSFDPVHYGHLLLAECCREQARLDQVWFMPAAVSPHKREGSAASPSQRARAKLRRSRFARFARATQSDPQPPLRNADHRPKRQRPPPPRRRRPIPPLSHAAGGGDVY